MWFVKIQGKMNSYWSPSANMLEQNHHPGIQQQIRRKPVPQRADYSSTSTGDSSITHLLSEDDETPHFPRQSLSSPEVGRDTSHKPRSPFDKAALPRSDALRTPSSARPDFKHFSSKWWLSEFAFLGLALASLVALIIVLFKFNDQPQKAWPYSVITLNSFVSFLVASVRTASMIPVADALSQGMWLWLRPPHQDIRQRKTLADVANFDSASRGPWGSAKLLGRTKLRSVRLFRKIILSLESRIAWHSKLIHHSHRHSASLGAVVVLLAIAIDPLSQLLLSVEYRSVDVTNEHEVASVSRAERYASWSPGPIQSCMFPLPLFISLSALHLFFSKADIVIT